MARAAAPAKEVEAAAVSPELVDAKREDGRAARVWTATRPDPTKLMEGPRQEPRLWHRKTVSGGLYAYNLDGSEHAFLPLGQLNNVDLRSSFTLGERTVTRVTATNRDDDSLVIVALGKPKHSSLVASAHESRQPGNFARLVDGSDWLSESKAHHRVGRGGWALWGSVAGWGFVDEQVVVGGPRRRADL